MASSNGEPLRGSAIRTFLIADVRGYTRFTARYGDEAASRLASKFAEIAGEGVEAWGGELVELRGDEALAVFDSPRQALRAALELQSAFADETATESGLPLGVGIGLDIGEAVPVGDGYRGAALNLAARMCSIAGQGEVLASEGLVRLVGHVEGLEYTTLEPTTFKGYDEPIAAVRVDTSDGPQGGVAVAPQPPGAKPPPLPPELDPIVPLAGREAEVRWLSWHWRRARHGHGRTVVLSGPPGIGKTRLSAELATIAHDGGAAVVYVPAVRLVDGFPADDADAAAERPVLTIFDDIDAAAADAVSAVVERARDLAGRPGMLLVIHRREAPLQLIAVAERLAPPEQRRTVGPIDSDAVRAIVVLYAGHATDEAPIGDLLGESGGVPAAVHRVASHWARTAAAGRLGSSADRTAAGRRGLRAAEAALVGDVADLELARERERLYVVDPADEDGPAAGSRTVCPYKGLAEFEAADADYYFGRERLVAELIARFVGGTFLALVGDSGSGKSSTLRAGLLPALAGGVLPGSATWPQAIFRPGEHPTSELLRALARARPGATLPVEDASAALDAALAGLATGERLVLVVDQFEEVFNATRDEAERSAFIELLTRERGGLRVIVAMRADYYGRCAAYPALARLLGSDQVLVGPLSSAEIAAVIEHPAQRVGLRVEPALTEALVADAGSEPGVLPLLSTALLELWGARDAGRLTLAAYRASGGLQGAIARLAEATYAGLDPHRQAVTRALLLRLAGPGEGTELVRRRVPLSELGAESDPVVAEVLETLTAARLLTSGDGHVEVAHEALLREWPRLQGWLDEDAAGRQVRLHLIGAVRDWEQRGREPGDLYRGARLAAALDWATEHQVELNATERTFLDESRQASEKEVERQRRMNRRLRMLLAGAAVLLVVAVGAGGFAAVQGQRAADEADRAEQQKVVAEQQKVVAEQEALNARSRELIASALAARDRDPSLAKLLAVEAMNVVSTPTYQSTSVLHEVLVADPIVARYAWPADHPAPGLFTDLAPDGELLVATGTARLEVADPRTGAVLWSYPNRDVGIGSEDDFVGGARFSADGTEVINGLFWGNPDHASPTGVALGIAIWDARTGELKRTIDVGPCGGIVSAVSRSRALVWTPAPGPDGRTGCHWSDDGKARIEVVDLATGTPTVLSDRATWGLGNGTLSGDGRFAGFDLMEAGACGASCFTSVVVDLEHDLKQVFRLEQDHAAVSPLFARQLSEDGTLLLYGDRPTYVYRITDGGSTRIAEWAGTGGTGDDPVFDPTDQTVLQTSRDGTLRRWEPTTGQVLSSWSAVGSGHISVAVDGRTVLVPNQASATALLLDIGDRGDLGDVQTCRGFTMGGSLKVRGGLAAFGARCDTTDTPAVDVVDPRDPRQPTLLASWPEWWSQDLAISPDGRYFVSQQVRGYPVLGPLAVADLATGAPVVELQGTCDWDSNAPPDPQPGCQPYPGTPFAFALPSTSLRWSPDGAMIAAVDNTTGSDVDGRLVVWDASDGRIIFRGSADPTQSVNQVLFTPGSKGLVVSYFNTGLIEEWSTTTWEKVATATLDTSIAGVGKLGLIGFTPNGSTILALGGFGRLGGEGDATLLWLDAATLQPRDAPRVEHAHTGSPKSMALNPDGSLMATGASDGILRVWDTKTGALSQQLDFGGREVQGIAFIDDGHLAVTPQGGDLLIMTVDPAELLSTVRASLTRSFATAECKRYAIEPCPTLEQMRAGG
jgi:class 3 adenylate cyclase/WD40 repeat protein/energy-coupling factor transporter ATP-binding protein EcfA2